MIHTPGSYRVLLISLVNWDSMMEIPALLKKAGCAVDVFCVKDSWIVKNKYYDTWIPAPEDPQEFIDSIITFIGKEGIHYNWIIPCDDILIRLLNEKITGEDEFYRIMPITKIENRQLLGSKAGFSNLCKKYNIDTPAYIIYNDNLLPLDIGKQLGYPLLMKVDKSEGGYGVFLCEDEQSLVANLDKITEKGNLVFQQFIKGYDVNTEVLYKNGELLVYSPSRTTKIISAFGASTQREFYNIPELEPVLTKMGKDFGVNGFGNVVFMYSEPENKYYLIEADLRMNAWMYYGKYMGNDFSLAVKKIINNDLTLLRPPEKYKDQRLKISHYKKDVYRCIQEKDWKGLAQWFTNKDKRWRYIPFYDSKLFFACTIFLLGFFNAMATQKIRKTFSKSAK